MKLVINKCYGGFGLSVEAVKLLIKKDSPLIKKMTYSEYTGGRKQSIHDDDDWQKEDLKSVGDGFYVGWAETVLYDESGKNVWSDTSRDYENRTHPDLIQVVETLGVEEASGKLSELKIVEIPDGVEYEIDEYDGIESVHESHRSWG